MSRLHEIKNRINSVKSTKKITRAMYLISASKSQRAKATMEKTRPYFFRIFTTLSEILAMEIPQDTYFIGHKKATEGKGSLYIVLAGDKGMAGGYNRNILTLLDQVTDKDKDTFFVAGLLGRRQIIRAGYNVNTEFTYPVMNPTVYCAREIAETVVSEYLTNQYREVYIVYTVMPTPLVQVPVVARLLPLQPKDFAHVEGVDLELSENDLIHYEPTVRDVFDHLVPHYLKGIIYSSFVEAFTSELHARMYAMDSANKSADDMISRLALGYNRARQAQITQEINEIVSGIPK